MLIESIIYSLPCPCSIYLGTFKWTHFVGKRCSNFTPKNSNFWVRNILAKISWSNPKVSVELLSSLSLDKSLKLSEAGSCFSGTHFQHTGILRSRPIGGCGMVQHSRPGRMVMRKYNFGCQAACSPWVPCLVPWVPSSSWTPWEGRPPCWPSQWWACSSGGRWWWPPVRPGSSTWAGSCWGWVPAWRSPSPPSTSTRRPSQNCGMSVVHFHR